MLPVALERESTELAARKRREEKAKDAGLWSAPVALSVEAQSAAADLQLLQLLVETLHLLPANTRATKRFQKRTADPSSIAN